jgi:hypothetical protein
VVADFVLSIGDQKAGTGISSIDARAVLLALLGAVHLLHQIRAIAQGFRVTKAL